MSDHVTSGDGFSAALTSMEEIVPGTNTVHRDVVLQVVDGLRIAIAGPGSTTRTLVAGM